MMRQLPAITIILLFCALPLSAQLLYHQDFGGNDVSDPRVSGEVLPECRYQQMYSDSDGSHTRSFSVRKEGFRNGREWSQWYIQCDRTHPDDYMRGYFLMVDGGLRREVFYEWTVTHDFRPGDCVDFSLWVANVYTYRQKDNYQNLNNVRPQDPDFFVVVRDAWDQEITRYRVGPVPVDSTLTGRTDWQCSSEWHFRQFSFTLHRAERSLVFQFENAAYHSPGNDFAIDEIRITKNNAKK